MRAAYPAHLVLLYFMTEITSGEPQKLWSCSSYIFFSIVTFSLHGPFTLLSTRFSRYLFLMLFILTVFTLAFFTVLVSNKNHTC